MAKPSIVVARHRPELDIVGRDLANIRTVDNKWVFVGPFPIEARPTSLAVAISSMTSVGN